MDLAQYNSLTQSEVDVYLATLNRVDYEPEGIAVELWDGQPFAGLTIKKIKETWGETFWLVKQKGTLLFVSLPEITQESVVENMTMAAMEAKAAEHFRGRLKPEYREPTPTPEPYQPTNADLPQQMADLQADLIIAGVIV